MQPSTDKHFPADFNTYITLPNCGMIDGKNKTKTNLRHITSKAVTSRSPHDLKVISRRENKSTEVPIKGAVISFSCATSQNTAPQTATISLKVICMAKLCFPGFKGCPLIISLVLEYLKEPDPSLCSSFLLHAAGKKSDEVFLINKKELIAYTGCF